MLYFVKGKNGKITWLMENLKKEETLYVGLDSIISNAIAPYENINYFVIDNNNIGDWVDYISVEYQSMKNIVFYMNYSKNHMRYNEQLVKQLFNFYGKKLEGMNLFITLQTNDSKVTIEEWSL